MNQKDDYSANCMISGLDKSGYLVVRIPLEERRAIEELLNVKFRADYMNRCWRTIRYQKDELKVLWSGLKALIPEWHTGGTFDGR